MKLPLYEKAIREYERFLLSVPSHLFIMSSQAVISVLRRTRPPTTMLSLHIMRLAYAQLVEGRDNAARMLFLAALAVSCKQTQDSLIKWSQDELVATLKSLKKPAKKSKNSLPPLPPIEGVPPQVIGALNKAIGNLDLEALKEGTTVVNTEVGPMEVFKKNKPFGSVDGDPRLN